MRGQNHEWWIEAAKATGIDTSGLNLDAPLSTRVVWANAHSLTIGTAYTRFSTDRQSSTEAQVRAIVLYAAAHGIYVPPEFVCVDEAKKGRTQSRPGLDRM